MKKIDFVQLISYSIVLSVFLYAAYLYFTYIDETMMDGSAYGFTTGASKSNAYMQARKEFSNKNVYIVYPVDDDGIGEFKRITFDGKFKEVLFQLESWKIYYKEDLRDYVELTFEGDSLFSIYRKRQNFEFP